jgi:hypothetical protein
MIIARYRIFDTTNDVAAPYEAARPLPDGKVLGKTDEAVNDGLTAEEMSKFIKENYPEQDEQ